jgi:hypothetical protein
MHLQTYVAFAEELKLAADDAPRQRLRERLKGKLQGAVQAVTE